MRIGRHVQVTGIVQGVFFRAWMQQQASELGVSGWARNCRDGSIEAYLAGSEQAVAKLIERLHDGPPSARVASVEVKVSDPGDAHGFEIRH